MNPAEYNCGTAGRVNALSPLTTIACKEAPMAAIKHITPDVLGFLHEALSYDPATGALKWKERPRHHFNSDAAWKRENTKHAGLRAGCIDHYGHRTFGFLGVKFRAARIIYLMVTGVLPDVVDHINGDRSDDRWENLRSVSHRENLLNMRLKRGNTSGFNGVWFSHNEQKWKSEIKVNWKKIHLGTFDCLDDAVAARVAADIQYGYANGVRPKQSEAA